MKGYRSDKCQLKFDAGWGAGLGGAWLPLTLNQPLGAPLSDSDPVIPKGQFLD